eukprot:9472283-Pyramimonas_sp.AAC.1
MSEAAHVHAVMDVPFLVIPGAALGHLSEVNLEALMEEVDLRQDDIWLEAENRWHYLTRRPDP